MLPPWKRSKVTTYTTERRRSNRGDPPSREKIKVASTPLIIKTHTLSSSRSAIQILPINDDGAAAGPSKTRYSPSSSPLSEPSPVPEVISTLDIDNIGGSSSRAKGKGKARVQGEKRVLPARARRAAGGGAEGVRDLEEMIIDWLERYGEVNTAPPEDLQIYLTTSALDELEPPLSTAIIFTLDIPQETSNPMHPVASGSEIPSRARLVVEGKEKIEVPSWIMVGPGEDDREEAREEMESFRGRRPVSLVKRLRKALIDESREDTSDAHYHTLHKKYEAFERRQRIRERESLTFERHKLRSRMELLRNMSEGGWTSLVGAVLRAREGERGKQRVEEEGVEWLRRRLVREGKEVLKRYDQLLPVEPRKPKQGMERTSTLTPDLGTGEIRGSSVDSEGEQGSPVPVPARVAALKDSKRRASSPLKKAVTQATPIAKAGVTRSRSERGLRRGSSVKRKRSMKTEENEGMGGEEEEGENTSDYDDVGAASARSRKERRRASVKDRQNGNLQSRIPAPPREKTGDGPSANLRRKFGHPADTHDDDDQISSPPTPAPKQSIFDTYQLERPIPTSTPEVTIYTQVSSSQTKIASSPLKRAISPRKASTRGVDMGLGSGWKGYEVGVSREEDLEMASVEAAVVI